MPDSCQKRMKRIKWQ